MKANWMVVVAVQAVLSCRGSEPPRRPMAMAATGTIEGVVRLGGHDLPTPTSIENTTDPAVCGRGQTLDDLVVSADNRGIRYAIVALVDVPEAAIPAADPGRLRIDNSGCRFSPHASVATVGSTVEAVNSDPILHTTHLYGPADLNISLPVKGARATRELARPGLYIVKCDIHGWMQAFIRVDPHPFHAVTDAQGSFRIEGVPAGRYRIEVWHEKLGTREVEAEIEEGRTSSLSIEFPSPKEVQS
jgi:plastocyanin